MTLREQILELRLQGLTYNEIVARLGCAKSTVAYHVSDSVSKNVKVARRDRRNLMRRYVEKIKDDAVCMDCEIDYPRFVLQFDHRPGEIKLCNVSDLGQIYSMEALEAEIAKCDIVCANCHAYRSWRRKTTWHVED